MCLLPNTLQVAINVKDTHPAVASFVSLGARCGVDDSWFDHDWSAQSVDLNDPTVFPVAAMLLEFCYQEQFQDALLPACGPAHIPDPGQIVAALEPSVVANWTAELDEQEKPSSCKPECAAAMHRYYRMCQPLLQTCMSSWIISIQSPSLPSTDAQATNLSLEAIGEWGKFMTRFDAACEESSEKLTSL
eukprot:SAG11_NODE_3709_length_2267_cov_1.221863_2_plen_189_part_00